MPSYSDIAPVSYKGIFTLNITVCVSYWNKLSRVHHNSDTEAFLFPQSVRAVEVSRIKTSSSFSLISLITTSSMIMVRTKTMNSKIFQAYKSVFPVKT